MPHVRTCLICGAEFTSAWENTRYCSDKCRREKHRLHKEAHDGKAKEPAEPLGPTYAELQERIRVLEAKERANERPILLIRACAHPDCTETFEVRSNNKSQRFCSKVCARNRDRSQGPPRDVFYTPSLWPYTGKPGRWNLDYCHFYPPAGEEAIKMIGACGEVDARRPDRHTGI